MSLANDPEAVRVEDEPPTFECRRCDRSTHDPSRICPDCYHEQRGGRR